MIPDRVAGLLECILFLESEPVDLSGLVRISGLNKETVLRGLALLREEYRGASHGIELIELGGGYLFSPKKEFCTVLKFRYGKKSADKLSRAALETLSIIAYSQPSTKSEIENIRGVAADGMLKLLCDQNLIREMGKKDAPGRPILFGTTRNFLKVFRLSSIADLPKLDELEKDRFEASE